MGVRFCLFFNRASDDRKEPSGRTKPRKGDGKEKVQNKPSMQGSRDAEGKQQRPVKWADWSQQKELGCQQGEVGCQVLLAWVSPT